MDEIVVSIRRELNCSILLSYYIFKLDIAKLKKMVSEL